MSSTKDYSVGWISAIKAEYVAADVFLDETHDRPADVPADDYNDYTFGKIGEHNVVISALPKGEYGESSATGVIKDMIRSFTNVRIALMVGIGGGAPSAWNDIRLGDIVVGVPGNREGGVLQYDFGKTIQGQSFQPTGFLSPPPRSLLAAVQGLDKHYTIRGHKIEEAVMSVLDNNPRLRRDYGRPEMSTDRLYKSDVVHLPGSKAPCLTVCGDDKSVLVIRNERHEDEDNTKIHYGLIASANSLMKDAEIRDRFAQQNDVLCFEMEAAGLVKHFPCLVIRGICDYSDSHKSKEWQGFAAMVAAAYAKDLLNRLPPVQVAREKKVAMVLEPARTYHNTSITLGDYNSGIQVGQNNGTITHGAPPPGYW
ncbi:hypothetical protein PCG10_000725 [Penicillium crustosum]|uniref:Nucleoside phosphorylase domain-containing protein n=1 Tax=Penicillium crustosum TaxID=36656 RepID=A0A9P5GGR3_PENCR|nr:Nucleoside phosphorylase [Penicillium crustosum]KAF7517927.1 hypothetical protein PCG10_000725 [Penicillium crustosum]KAJ5394851.1 Nucleoside phosphorylase [Penicillium crustosum]